VLKFAEIIELLKKEGYKETEQRKEIINVFLSFSKYVSVKAVHEEVSKKFPGISFDTLYRNVALLSQLGILEEMMQENETKYRIACTDEHHHHFVCVKCGKTEIIPACPLNYTLIRELTTDKKIVGHKFEILIICKECLAKENQRE